MKHISLIFILFCLSASCTTVKYSNSQETVFLIIDDYISDYRMLYPDKKIEALLAYAQVENSKLIHVVILDYPLQVLFSDIRNKKKSDSVVTFGLYRNIPINLSISGVRENQLMTFFAIDSSLIERAQLPPEYFDKFGKKLNMDFDGFIEYEPFLISKYIFKDKIKTLQMLDGKIIREKLFLKSLKKEDITQ